MIIVKILFQQLYTVVSFPSQQLYKNKKDEVIEEPVENSKIGNSFHKKSPERCKTLFKNQS